jgi:hypothetical protein
MDDDNDALVRKVTPFQRRCILLYWVETNDGGIVDILYLPVNLAVRRGQFSATFIGWGSIAALRLSLPWMITVRCH